MISIIYFIMGLVGIGFFILIIGAGIASRPTKGQHIETYANPQSALLVIDIQEDFTGADAKKPFPYPNAAEMIVNANRAIETASKKGMAVAYIRHEWPNRFIFRAFFGGRAIEGQPGASIDKRVKVVNSNFFTKKIGDAFSNPELNDFLIENRVNQIYLVGLDASGCVLKTAEGALNRGYGVTVLEDATVGFKSMDNVSIEYCNRGIHVQEATTNGWS